MASSIQQVKECRLSFVLCVLAVGFVLCGATYWLVDHLHEAELKAKDAAIRTIETERDAALRDAERQKPELASLRSEKERLAKENSALKKTGR
jgi:hypothetical protein